jgi:signal transduction histidine kinase/predicted negative regulator of RcsB-dependent stress response
MSEIFKRDSKITEQPDGEGDILSFIESLTESAETKPSECIEQSAKLLEYAVEKKDRLLEAKCLQNLAVAFYSLCDYKQSLSNINKALEIFKELNDEKGIATSLNNKGRVFIEIGKYEEALENQLESLKLLERLGDKKGVSKLYNNIGLIYWYCENYNEALEYHTKSLNIKKELNDRRGIAKTFNNLGNVYKYIERPADAISSYKKALKINEELGNKKGISFCLNNLGTVYKDLGKDELALDCYNRSLKLKEELADKQGIANSYLNLGVVFTDKKDFRQAGKYFEKGFKLAEEEDMKHVLKGFYYNYMELYSKKGVYKKALEYFKKYVELKESLFNEEIARKFTEFHLRYDIEKMEKENELLRQKNEIQKLELESQKNLKELNATKDKFFSIIAHDIKSPFAVMLSFLNILKRTENYEKEVVMRLVADMEATIKASLSLLANLLEWSRTQRGRIEFAPVNLKLKPTSDWVLSLLGGNAQTKEITIINKVNPAHRVFADKNMLNTVLRNLISNAIKFSYKGGEIRVSSSEENGEIKISVSDCGIGIEPALIDKIFCIDTKTNTLGTAGEKGTGIGLILCKEFVECMGGKIWAESSPGKGSTFCFILPKGD